MENVKIKKLGSYKGKYLFEVNISGLLYRITLGRDYWLELTGDSQPAAQLILDSIMFLLSREPKENILKEFDVSEIKNYFPDYEKLIRNR